MELELWALWYLLQLRKTQWLRSEQLRKLQERKLKAIVRHAYNNTDFYHRKFDLYGLKPEAIKTIEDLQKLPITTRTDIRNSYPDGIVARGTNLDGCIKRKTSGSTGTPMDVVFNKNDQAFRIAVYYRAMIECGLRIADKLFTISSFGHKEEGKKWFQHLRLLRQKNVSPTNPLEHTIQTLIEYRPDVLYGPASYITLLSRIIKEKRIRELRPRLVFSHAELLDSKDRNFINSVFETQLFDTYGSVEFIRLAWECPQHAGYHIDADGYIVEFVEDGQNVSPGEKGEIVVTSLHGQAMPFLRYALGDVGIPLDEKCPCGRGLPLMKTIEGRAEDFIVLPNGWMVSPRSLTAMMNRVPGIAQYRIIQKTTNTIRVELIKGEGFSEKTLLQVIAGIKRILNAKVQVHVRIVDEMPKGQLGKTRTVISEVQDR